MGASRWILAFGLALLLVTPQAFADETAPMDAPPAGIAEPAQPPAPPPSIVVEDVPVTQPTAQPAAQPMLQRPCPTPCAPPRLQAFDATVYNVTERTTSCAPRCPEPCDVKRCATPYYTCCERRSPGYGGIMLQAYPGLGWGVEFGQWFCRTKCADIAWELNLNYQDLTDDFNNISTGQSGKWMGARFGLKASFMPKKCFHPVVRAGLGWNIATGDMDNTFDVGDIPATPRAVNYFGGYLGVGLEMDLFKGRVTTGPEIYAFAGPLADRSEGDDGAYTATVAWHIILNF